MENATTSKAAKKVVNKLLMKMLLLIVMLMLPVEAAFAQEEKAPAVPAASAEEEAKTQTESSPAEPAPKSDPQPAPQNTSEKTVKEAAYGDGKAFVDRDGDGIQDGKEHRFRGKHRHRGGKDLSGEEGEGSKIRHRQRNGRR